MIRHLQRLAALVLALALGACAIGNKQDFRPIAAQLPYSGKGAVAVLAVDERPYVLAGDKNPDYVGYQRNRVGIPFNVKTASGRPLAAELTDAFVRSLSASGFAAQARAVAPRTGADSARAALLRGAPRRALLVEIVQWESTSFFNTTLEHELHATVYDGAGHALASQTVEGSEHLEGTFLRAPKTARETVPSALAGKIQALLNTPAMRAALQS